MAGCQGRNVNHAFAGQPDSCPTGSEYGQCGDECEQLAQNRAYRVHDVFTTINHQQDGGSSSGAIRPIECIDDGVPGGSPREVRRHDRAGDLIHDGLSVGLSRQPRETRPVHSHAPSALISKDDLLGKACLADTAATDERDQPPRAQQQCRYQFQFVLATYEIFCFQRTGNLPRAQW
ncbi:hypothetical protein NWFMUON74_68870 [Nocardia wallacei]|uniref:Uncharacterized protein n=1 Tax=Nocardia wallacei TaxID=480035 RepID=A0A7G1KV16_9NOCA|nr:hypothetical protein NWFMUON74_68870 [Nocardia wallacei]